MSLRDDLTRIARSTGRCVFQQWVDTLPGEDREAVADALVSKNTSADLTRVFRMHGYDRSAVIVARHRRKDCACVSCG